MKFRVQLQNSTKLDDATRQNGDTLWIKFSQTKETNFSQKIKQSWSKETIESTK